MRGRSTSAHVWALAGLACGACSPASSEHASPHRIGTRFDAVASVTPLASVDPTDHLFARVVALRRDGNLLAASGYQDTTVYRRDSGGDWLVDAVLPGDAPSAYPILLGVAGDWIATGTYAASMFHLEANGWTRVQTLSVPGFEPLTTISMDDTTLLLCTPSAEASVFELTAGSWQLTGSLAMPPSQSGSYAQGLCAVDGGTAATSRSSSNLVYIYARQAAGWVLQDWWALPNGERIEALALHGDSVVVTGTKSYHLVRNGSSWVSVELSLPGTLGLALSEDLMTVFTEQGVAVLERSAAGWVHQASFLPQAGQPPLSGWLAVANRTVAASAQSAVWVYDGLDGDGRGTPCTEGTHCFSGSCVDGFCCTSTCEGQCETCSLPGFEGTCTRVIGAPAANRQPCGFASADCLGTCTGDSPTCIYHRGSCWTAPCFDTGQPACLGNCQATPWCTPLEDTQIRHLELEGGR